MDSVASFITCEQCGEKFLLFHKEKKVGRKCCDNCLGIKDDVYYDRPNDVQKNVETNDSYYPTL